MVRKVHIGTTTVVLTASSIEEAKRGSGNAPMNEDPRKYNRKWDRYAYRSHLQYVRAVYGLIGCTLFALFSGWQKQAWLGDRPFINDMRPHHYKAAAARGY